MQPRGLAWIAALALATALVPAGTAQQGPPAQLLDEEAASPLLVEVQPNPPGIDRGSEWLELHNPSPVNLSLDPFYVADHDFCFADDPRLDLNGTIGPGERLVVTLPGSCIILGNTGDSLFLEDEEGRKLQNVTYGPGTEQPAPASGTTLAACEVGPSHGWWAIAHPSPGRENPGCGPL